MRYKFTNLIGAPVMGMDLDGLAMGRFSGGRAVTRFHGLAFDKAEGGGAPADADGGAGDPPAADKAKKPPTADELAAELDRTRKALKDANADGLKHRKQVEAYEADDAKRKKEEEDRKTAELTELQKAQKRADELEAIAKQKDDDLARERIDNAIERAATQLGFRDPADALRLIDRSRVTMGEDGKPAGAKELLEELAKAKPYLVEKSDGSAGTQGAKPAKGTPMPKSKQAQPGQPGNEQPAKPLVQF